MFRKSALAMAMLGALTTGNVVALGLGDIELKSALNQPLNAEVALLSATDAEMQELKVLMGSPQAFERAGIERPLFLSKVKFDVTRNSAGKPVVLITSRDVIREPFLDFLMEISWSKGRLLREYTVLVDPPLTMPAAAPAIQAPASPAVQSAPVSSQQQVRQHTAFKPTPVAPGEYGPTRRNDTLWQVATQVRPDSDVSIEQTMIGLLRANPEAFVNNNINNLKAGYVLQVPSREALTSLSKADARRESAAQYAEWRGARSGSVAGASATETLLAAESVAAEQSVDTASSLELVAPEGTGAASATGSAAAGSDIESVQRELIMANEAMEAQRRQSEDMSSRLAVLEEQLQNMQRMIQLKDDELAQLQSQVATEAPLDALAEGVEESAVTDEAVADVVGADVVSEAVTDEITDAATAAPDDGVAVMDDAEVPVTETTNDVVEDAASNTDAEPVTPAMPVTATEPGFVEHLMNNPLWLGAGGVVLALLAFFGLRRKRGVETEFQESILQASGSDLAGSDSEIVATASGPSSSSESSLLSEFAVSDMGSMRNDGEADPLAEADVYLAYGRFQQAEDLIADALEKDADNEDLNLKMLEVFLAAKNKPAFDGHAELILARLEDSDGPMWQKVAEMGREISPDSPMYQSGGATTDSVASVPDETDSLNDEDLNFDMDLSASADAGEFKPDSADFTPPDESAEAAAPALDINMDSVEPDAIEQENTLDFDIDSLAVDGDDAEAESGDGELADMDEISTKLDLARAYIDMGDPDGARSILDEVIEEGDDGQKDEARGIMGQIA